MVLDMSDVVLLSGCGPRERRQRACEAALGVAARLGLNTQRPVILQDWNNTIIRLAPAAIVAKVANEFTSATRGSSLWSVRWPSRRTLRPVERRWSRLPKTFLLDHTVGGFRGHAVAVHRTGLWQHAARSRESSSAQSRASGARALRGKPPRVHPRVGRRQKALAATSLTGPGARRSAVSIGSRKRDPGGARNGQAGVATAARKPARRQLAPERGRTLTARLRNQLATGQSNGTSPPCPTTHSPSSPQSTSR